MSKEYLLTQKIVVNGGLEVDRNELRSLAYIECASMDGNKLLLELVDMTGVYRDNYSVKQGATLEVTFSDVANQGDQVWIEKFIILKSSSRDGILTVEAFQHDAHLLKQPEIIPQFFVEKQPKEILQSLLPNLKIDCDQYEKGGTYHLNAGGTKSRLIRVMARDYGSVAFVCRGTVYFKSIKNLALSPQFKLEHLNNAKANHAIINYSILGEEALFKRVLNKNYIAWDTVEGMQTGTGEGAKNFISISHAKSLNNQKIAIIPVLDVELHIGNTQFKPFAVCEVQFHKIATEPALDESLPQHQIINRVTHFERGYRYQCRIELGIKNL